MLTTDLNCLRRKVTLTEISLHKASEAEVVTAEAAMREAAIATEAEVAMAEAEVVTLRPSLAETPTTTSLLLED